MKTAFRQRDFFWHTSCRHAGVARKFHNQSFAPGLATAATMNLRMASFQLASIGVPPRAQRVHQPRRRLSVECLEQAPQTVKIRHASQKLDTVTAELPAVSLQCVP